MTLATLVRALEFRADFPGIGDWHYLDTAATAQKPQAVIDATVRAMGADYATVHRGVYRRSADMTLAYESARQRVATFIGAQSEDEIVFVRGATEGINLVAQSWGQGLKAGDRILLSVLEHHSNIVPWQLLRDRAGIEIDVCPLTADGRIDLDAAEAMLTPAHKLVAFAHVSNVLGSTIDAKRAAELAHAVGAKLLLDGCQAGIGVLWARADLLDTMPPWQGGGAMIDRVTFERTTYAPPPQRFEAGTPAIVEAVGLHAAIDYVEAIGLEAIHAHETDLVRQTREALRSINFVTLFGPDDAAGIVSFAIEGVHPHDIGTILDEEGVAIRAGHHCAQPLMEHLGVPATARASFGIYSNENDVAALVRGIDRVQRIFGA